ncbi:hypothetical protein D3C71_2116220 [compost metagenome]
MVLSEPGRGVAVLLQYFADRRVLDADDRVIARITGRLFRDDAEACRVMIAAGDKRGTRRRAERGGMELRKA